MIGLRPILAILFFCVALGAAVVGVFAFPNQPPEEQVKCNRNRSFEHTVAEGVRTWNPKTGVNSIRFDACRIEKMKMGSIYLGMFDVLCLDGLVLNLPFPEARGEERGGKRDERGGMSEERAESREERGERSEEHGGMSEEGMEPLAGLLPQTFLRWIGVSIGNLAGIRIKGFAVNRVENQREVPVFAADKARNYGPTLKLRNCRVFESGRTNLVGVAYLMLKPAPALVWKDGRRRLDDLFPNYCVK